MPQQRQSDSASLPTISRQDSNSHASEAGGAAAKLADVTSSEGQKTRLALLDTVEGDEADTGPSIELVHVAAMCPQEDFHDASTLLPESKARRTVLMFRVELDDLLVGDLVEAFVEQQAIYLLQGLVANAAQQMVEPADASAKRQKPVFAFLAYDIGAAIVNTAIWFAAKHPDIFPHVFSRTFTVVFSGCPQRAPGGEIGMASVLSSLLCQKTAVKQDCHLEPLHLRSLARLMISTAGLFVASKITLRSRVVSIHANESRPGHIDSSITIFVGTLGVPTEISIQEETDGNESYPSLGSWVTLSYNAIPRSEWEDLDDVLLCLAPPHTQHRFAVPFLPSALDRVRSHAAFTDWRDHSGVQILYIAGASSGPALEVAHIVISALTGGPDKEEKLVQCFDASFDEHYDGIPGLVASVLSQAFAYGEIWRGDRVSEVIRNQHVFRTGWNRTSSFNILTYYRGIFNPSSVLLLRDFDRCRKEDREALLDYLSELSKRSESRWKFIVTSTIPNALVEELQSWSILKADDVSDCSAEQTYELSDILRHVPTDEVSGNIQKDLEKLDRHSTGMRRKMLHLLGECSGWPSEAAQSSLHEFCRLLHATASTKSIEEALDGIIRSRTRVRGFTPALSLLLCSHCRLSLRELIFMSLHQEAPEDMNFSDHQLRSMEIRQHTISNTLEQSLRGLVVYDGIHIQLRSGVQQLMSDANDAYVWNDLRRSAPTATFELCFSLLICEGSRDSLSSIAGANGSIPDSSRVPSPSMLLRKETIQYAVRALPYHLQKCPRSTINRVMAPESESVGAALLAWAQAYWATSSQFLRMPERPESHVTILSMVGIGTYEDISRDRCSFVAAALGSRTTVVDTWLEKGYVDVEDLISALVSAIQVGNETLALRISDTMISRHREQIVWPVTVLRAAVWNKMSQLVDLLLKNGVNPNSREDYGSIEAELGYRLMTPLFIAGGLGLVKIFHALLNAGARADETDVDQVSYLERAVINGDPDIVIAIFEQSLYTQWRKGGDDLTCAAECGNWRTCQLLLNKVGDPGPHTDEAGKFSQNALISACAMGFVKTTRVLLEHGANPSVPHPENEITTLWHAAVSWSDVQMVQDLLIRGANPNAVASGQPLLLDFLTFSEGDDDTLLSICDAFLSHRAPVDINARNENDGWTALMVAARYGRLSMVNWLIDNGAEMNAVNHRGYSALYLAVHQRHADVVRRLLRESPDVDRVNSDGMPLIHYALPDLEILTLLLDAGANAEAADGKGWRLIHCCVTDGNEDILKLLLDRKVDINAPSAQGWPPLYYAVDWATIDTVRLLVEGGSTASGSINGTSILHMAIARSPDMLRAVLGFRRFLDLELRDSDDETPLMAARIDIQCWKLMINAGVDLHAVKNDRWTALHFAVEPGMTEFRSVLLSQPDIDVERGGIFGPPLYWACERLEIEAVRDLLTSGASAHSKPAVPSFRYATSLVATICGSWSEEKGDWEEAKNDLIRLLISHGSDVREKIPGSLLPGALFHACLITTPELVTILLDEGALASESSSLGHRFPLHYAATNGIGIFKLIHDAHEGDMMTVDAGGRHCLHWAAQSGNLQTIHFILQRLKSRDDGISCYINTLDIDGWSPLCWAIRPFKDSRDIRLVKAETSDFEGTVRILLEHGADPTIECRLGVGDDKETLSVLELARRRRAGKPVIDMLKSAIGISDESSGNQTDNESPNISTSWAWCNVCFAVVLESKYICTDCEDWDVCAKCNGNIQLYHDAKTQDDGKPHSFEICPDEPDDNPSQESAEDEVAEDSGSQTDFPGGTGDAAILGHSDDDETLDLSDDDNA